MKKLLTYIFLALSLVTLAACGKNEAITLFGLPSQVVLL